MTIHEIIAALKAAGKPSTKRTVYRYLEALGIKPLGARQIPRRFPPDSAERILAYLGFVASVPQTRILTVKQALKQAGRTK